MPCRPSNLALVRLWLGAGLALTLAILPTLTGVALPAATAMSASEPQPQQSVLPNGLTVVSEHRPESHVAAIAIAVRAGSRFEDEATDSAAHLLEHMYLQGTASLPDRDAVIKPLATVGGALDVSAGWELFRFQASVRAADFDLAIELLAEILQRSLFDPDKLEKERRITLQELDEIQDSPHDLAFYTLRRELFHGQPLGRLPPGSEAGLKKLRRAELLAFRDRWIGANRATIAVVGPFEHSEVVSRVGVAFGALPPVAAPEAPRTDISLVRTGRLDLRSGAEQAVVVIGAPIPGVSHTDYHALLVLEAALSGFTGRLTTEIREKRGLAYRTSALLSLTSDGGYFAVQAGTLVENAEQVLELLRGELARLRAEPLPEAELRRAIGSVVGGRLVGTETALARASQLAARGALGIRETDDEFAAKVRSISAADVQRIAGAYLGPERQLVVVIRP